MWRWFRACTILVAVAAFVVPVPSSIVERWYSRGFYLRLQSILTPLANLIPVALFDLAAVGLVIASLVLIRRHRPLRARTAFMAVLTTAAAFYLVFLACWGFNYRRVQMEEKVAFAHARVTRDAAIRLATDAIGRVNDLHASAHARPFDIAALEAAFASAQRGLGTPPIAAVGVPKWSALTWYFRHAAIDGMTDPFFHEIIINPDVLPFERPWVMAHEWAHLAGYAHESEANYLAWLTCRRGDALAQYSAWLTTYEHAAGALSRDDRRRLPPLGPGPRGDLAAMAQRYERSAPVIRNAARDVYDSYLRANRVPEGVASYGAVLRLMLGAELDDQGNPRLRTQ